MEKNKPLVSFILTYYQLPVQMLCQCIDSIMTLSLRPFEREIIVVDDGSETSPINALLQYGDDIIYVRQKNQGLSMARNKGIEMAGGTYIQFVDADDYLVQTNYEHCLDIIRINPDIDLLMFDFTSNDTAMTTFEEQPITSGTEYMIHHNIHGTAWGYLFKKTTLSELRFRAGIWHEDEEFTPLLIIRSERMCVTNAKAYHYTKRPNSITTKGDEQSKDKRLADLLGVILNLRDSCDYLPHNEKMAIQRRVAQLTMDYIYEVIIEHHSSKALNDHLRQLEAEGLFPLPDRDYTKKYKWFRKMSNTSLGRNILLNTLPLWKRER